MSLLRTAPGSKRLGGLGYAVLVLLSACSPRLSSTIPLHLVHRELVQADSLEHVYGLRLSSDAGDTVAAFLRQPVPERIAGERLPGIVLVAGRETGRQAAAVVPGPLDGVVLAVEYPEVIPAELTAGALLGRLPGIRRSAYRMPGIVRGAARFLAAQPEVDSTRIALVGVSFGVPFATPAGADTIFRGVALHHGGANLGLLFWTSLPVKNSILRNLAANFFAWYLGRLEPGRHVGRISPTPLLLINGLHDTMVPRRSALLLAEAARPPVRQIWLPHDHLMPGDTAVMRELADSTIRHFPFLRRMSPAGSERTATERPSGPGMDGFPTAAHGFAWRIPHPGPWNRSLGRGDPPDREPTRLVEVESKRPCSGAPRRTSNTASKEADRCDP